MKKSVWLLCLFLSTFSLISCDKLFEPVKEPEKRYLSVTSMTPEDAMAYIGDVVNVYDSVEPLYIIHDCFGYPELCIASAVVEYSALTPAFNTYFDIEANARMQFDYQNLVYTSSRDYVEFIAYAEPEMMTDDSPSHVVAYELRYLCGDITNPPATGNYARKIIFSPDMQVDMLTGTILATGEKVNYWGTPSAGQASVQSAPVLAAAVPVFNGNNGGDDGDGYGAVQDYPSFIADFGDLLAVYSYRSDGNTSPAVLDDGCKMYSYYAEYSSLKSEVTLYFNSQPGYACFQRGSGITENAAHSYIEFSVFSDADDSLRYYDIRYLADLNRKINGEACMKYLNVDPDDLNGFNSIFEYLCSILPLTRPVNSSDYPDVWSQMGALGTISGIYANFDSDGNLQTTLFYDTLPQVSFLVEYSSLNADVQTYKNTHRLSCSREAVYSYSCKGNLAYVEYSIISDPNTDSTYQNARIFDTQKMINGEDMCGVSVLLENGTDRVIDYIRNGGTREITEGAYPDVWAELSGIGTLQKVYAIFDIQGNQIDSLEDPDETNCRYLAEYSDLCSRAEKCLLLGTLGDDPPSQFDFILNQSRRYVMLEWRCGTGINYKYVTLYDTQALVDNSEHCSCSFDKNNMSIYDMLGDKLQGVHEVTGTAIPSMLSQMGTIEHVYHHFDSEGDSDSTIEWDSDQGKTWFVEYSQIEQIVKEFLQAHGTSRNGISRYYPEYEAGHQYVEYWQKTDNTSEGLLFVDNDIYDTDNRLEGKAYKVQTSVYSAGCSNIYEYIQSYPRIVECSSGNYPADINTLDTPYKVYANYIGSTQKTVDWDDGTPGKSWFVIYGASTLDAGIKGKFQVSGGSSGFSACDQYDIDWDLYNSTEYYFMEYYLSDDDEYIGALLFNTADFIADQTSPGVDCQWPASDEKSLIEMINEL